MTGTKRMPLSERFWTAAPETSKERTPESVVLHALTCIRAFESDQIVDEAGKPISLLGLLTDLGMEENLVHASPELLRGESFDDRSLVFSIGVLIFERLTDSHPFGTTETGRIARQRRGEMGSGVNYFPAVPRQLRSILMQAMGPFPEERYRGLSEMTYDLANFAGAPQMASKPATPARPRIFDAVTKVGPRPRFDVKEDSEPEILSGKPAALEQQEPPQASKPPAETAQPEQQAQPAEQTRSSLSTETAPTAAPQKEAPPLPELPPPPPPPQQTQPTQPTDPFAPLPLPADEVMRQRRSTERVAIVKPESKWQPLLYATIGALVATVLFLLFTRSSSSPEPSESAGRIVTAPQTPDAVAAKRAPPPQAPPSKKTAKATPDPAPRPAASADAAVAKKAPSPPAQAVDRSVGRRVLEGGRRAMEMMFRCNPPRNDRRFRVAVFAQPDGRIARAFVSPTPWFPAEVTRCIKRTLRGRRLPFTLPKAGFVEWRFQIHRNGDYNFWLVRPKVVEQL